MRRCPFSPTYGHDGSGKPTVWIVSAARWSVPATASCSCRDSAEEVELHLLVVGAYIGVERASDAVGHALDIGSFARFQRIFLFLAQFHPFQLLRDDDFALSALALPLLHLAVQSPEVVIETALADVVLEACVVMFLPSLRPHALDQYGLAVHQP